LEDNDLVDQASEDNLVALPSDDDLVALPSDDDLVALPSDDDVEEEVASGAVVRVRPTVHVAICATAVVVARC
jgi:hypothetical protein